MVANKRQTIKNDNKLHQEGSILIKFDKIRAKMRKIGRLLVDMAPKKMPKTMARIKDPIARAMGEEETIEKLSKILKIGCPR